MPEGNERHLRVNGVRLWTATTGTGPPAVLCHGGPGLWDTLGPVAAMIDDLVTVHRYDQRGCGRSGRERPWTGDAFVDDLDALRAAWGHDRWIVGGHSAGASLALACALAHPERTAALLFLCGVSDSLAPDWHDRYHEERRRRSGPTTFHRDFADPDAALEVPGFDEFPVNHEVNRAVKWPGITAESCAGLAVPALVVHGDGDPRPDEGARRLAEILPGGEFVSLEGVGHFPWLERPELLREALRRFLVGLAT